ncbi:MAG: hypothetical protein ACM3JQ_05920 [Candidatus Eiseniibacteriota bacterium]
MKNLPEPLNEDASGIGTFTVNLDLDQTDLITCLLLDQLVKIESAEGELNPLMNSYADLLVQAKSGNVIDSRFLEELESLKGVIKDQPKYVTIIDTIIALWNM